jgi:hypothetical protein
LLETHQDALEQPRPMMVFYPGREMNEDETNWWGPNPPLMLHLLLAAGFTRILYRNHPVYGPLRGLYAAFRPEAEEDAQARLRASPLRSMTAPPTTEGRRMKPPTGTWW